MKQQPNKPTNTSRVLRFTVTSALAIAPLAGCGPSHTSNPGPTEVVEPNTNPGPEPAPVAVEVDAGEESDAGTDASATVPAQPPPTNAEDNGSGSLRGIIFHANPVAHEPVES